MRHITAEGILYARMFGKFRPPQPVIRAKLQSSHASVDLENVEPANKRTKLSNSLPAKPVYTVPRQVLQTLSREPDASIKHGNTADTRGQSCYTVLWRRITTKKHKIWENDGTIKISSGQGILQNDKGTEIARTPFHKPLLPGSICQFGTYEAEVVDLQFETTCNDTPSPQSGVHLQVGIPKALHLPKTLPLKLRGSNEKPKVTLHARSITSSQVRQKPFLTPRTEPLKAQGNLGAKDSNPRHDPLAPDAVVMTRPTTSQPGRQIRDVVIDPLLAGSLRDHQKEGVKFLYECVMGLRDYNGQGAILADEMGLGKTLQTITLIWTLLKQSPICGVRSVIKKVLIICPVTLNNNWRNEFRKWLGADRVGVYIYDDTKKRITDFIRSKAYSVLIVGYEKFRSIAEDLTKSQCIDLIVADEGHRLKKAKGKSLVAISALETSRRIILSGTPIQNDLGEFYTVVDFINPGLLGTSKSFGRKFEQPIVTSRQPGASSHEKEIGVEKSEDLSALTSPFILRRTAEVLDKHLPPKTEYIILCKPTSRQAAIYKQIISSSYSQAAFRNHDLALQLITVLKKVCNSPALLAPSGDSLAAPSTEASAFLSEISPNLLKNNQGSCKLRILDQLLHTLRTTTSEKVVLVSNYTSTLQILEQLLTSLGHPYLRLDGSTPSLKRQSLVDRFNRLPSSECFAFLLSAKAGGLGLNLVGASRLVLFDVDWNPAIDLQAMARIHRDGQKRSCKIYRFLMAGGIDEKIWQRQLTKLDLANNILTQTGGVNAFTQAQLQDLFTLDEQSRCQTHDLLKCACDGHPLTQLHSESSRRCPDFSSGQEDGSIGAVDSVDDGLPNIPQLISASRLQAITKSQLEATESKLRGSHTLKFSALMAYKHLDPSLLDLSADGEQDHILDDHVLGKVLKDECDHISWIFLKRSSETRSIETGHSSNITLL